MPKTIPLVSELLWVAASNDAVDTFRTTWTRSHVINLECGKPVFIQDAGYCWFTEDCRQKLLAAMDSYGKGEEPEHWKSTVEWAKVNSTFATTYHSKCLLELRQRIESLEGKK